VARFDNTRQLRDSLLIRQQHVAFFVTLQQVRYLLILDAELLLQQPNQLTRIGITGLSTLVTRKTAGVRGRSPGRRRARANGSTAA